MVQKETNIFSDVNSPKKSNLSKLLFSLVVVALIVTSSAAAYFYLQTVKLKRNPQEVAQQEVKNIVAKVSRLILLPEGESPTIATVTDPNLLKDQAFFGKTQKGDQILIYTNAKEAILYRPISNMIINVAPINIGNTQASAPTTPAATPTTKPTTTPPTEKKP